MWLLHDGYKLVSLVLNLYSMNQFLEPLISIDPVFCYLLIIRILDVGKKQVKNSCACREMGSLSLHLVLYKVSEGCIPIKSFHILSIEYICMTIKWTVRSWNWIYRSTNNLLSCVWKIKHLFLESIHKFLSRHSRFNFSPHLFQNPKVLLKARTDLGIT